MNVLGWADSSMQLFMDAGECLNITGNHMVIKNSDKFVLGQRELEYIGFWLKKDMRLSGQLQSSQGQLTLQGFGHGWGSGSR